MKYYLAVDSGGTFSDCVVISEKGEIWTGKSLSTPPDFERGIINAVRDAVETMGIGAAELFANTRIFSHGTTVATNALITRNGCKTAVITTKGHEDAMIIGRVFQKVAGKTSDEIQDLSAWEKAVPIVKKKDIFGISERIDYKGEEIVRLSLDELKVIADKLIEGGYEAVAVSLLWSLRNDSHEQAVYKYLKSRNPDWFLTLSSVLSPVVGEYERTATTTINAFLSKKIGGYLSDLADRLKKSNFNGEPLIMKSSGGIATIRQVKETSVSLLMSGPAGGVNGALALSRLLGHKNVVTTDVGGTSFDVGLIADGEMVLAKEPVFDQYNINYPMIDIVSIGAGGGSVAWVQEGTGLLKVGPQSAGALPGPVCYGKGGTLPTLTDANLVLGRMNPKYFLGGKQNLDFEGARRAIKTIADTMGKSIEETALGIVEIADAHMADLVRKMTVQRGYDPRTFALYSFGGAGPLQVCGYTRGTGIKNVVIPKTSSVFSAYGIVQSDINALAEESLHLALPADPDLIYEKVERLKARTVKEIEEGCSLNYRISTVVELMIKYNGQKQELPVMVPFALKTVEDMERVLDLFDAKYEQFYGKGTSFRQAGMLLVGLRVKAMGDLNLPEIVMRSSERPKEAVFEMSRVYLHESGGWTDVPFYKFDQLPSGFCVDGPAIIISNHTTIYIAPDFTARLDELENINLRQR